VSEIRTISSGLADCLADTFANTCADTVAYPISDTVSHAIANVFTDPSARLGVRPRAHRRECAVDRSLLRQPVRWRQL
jgi:hypothetical protein